MIEATRIHNHLKNNSSQLQCTNIHIIPYGLRFNVQAKGVELTVKVKLNLANNLCYYITIIDNVGRVVKQFEDVMLDDVASEIKSTITNIK